ncbi:MAG TPA: sensor domain-containing diguanylate cyclase [Kofleriaceae bacterium]|nr:sensor domain-containing diguanylate cyclase [Kofleriaceae bacterium]
MGSSAPSQPRLLAIIELQNAIAAAGMNADEVMHIVADRAATLTSADAAMVALVEGDDLVYRTVIGTTSHDVGARVPKESSPAGRCLVDRRAVRIDRAGIEESGVDGVSSIACVPLLYGETAVGVLEVLAPRAAALTDEDVETLRVLGQIIAIALHRAYTYPRPRYDSLQDALTGLGNRRAFDERLDAELNRNRRFLHSFSLAVIKLDGLEAASDRLGQAAGDEMLRKLAKILKQHTRTIDGCFRVHADEFAIVMPGTSLEGARVVAERCRLHSIESKVCDSAVRLGFGVVAAAYETAAEITARASAVLEYS